MEAELARLKAENDALRLQLGQAGGESNVDAVITSLIEQQQKRYEAPKGKYELRSDTLTKPTAAMRAAIATSEVGDAVWGTDPTVKALEEYVATLCGKEAALFVPSGVMGNLICVMCHCDARVSEVILGDRAHQMLYETSNLASVAGVQTRTVPNNADGTLPLEALQNAFRGLDQHWPTTRAVLLENTHNFTGGKVLPLDYIRQVRKICDSHIYPVALHCDGARAWHAAVALGVSMKELLECFDTASLCLSKALGAPVGSVIVGPKALIEGRAKRLVKMLGGGMRQTGIIASAGLYAVKNHFSRLQDDHAMAKALFVALSRVGVSAIEPQTNILIWNTPKPGSASRVIELCAAEGIMIGSIGSSLLRAIPHLGCGVSLEDVDRIAAVVAKAHAEVMSP